MFRHINFLQMNFPIYGIILMYISISEIITSKKIVILGQTVNEKFYFHVLKCFRTSGRGSWANGTQSAVPYNPYNNNLLSNLPAVSSYTDDCILFLS